MRLGLAAAVLLLVLAGAYSAFWFVVAGRIADGVGQWADALRGQNLDLSWRAVRVAGFPLAFRVELSDARLRDGATPPGAELRLKMLSGSARPWNFRVWHVAAPDGLSATAGPVDAPIARLSARTVEGSVALAGERGASVWLGLAEPVLEAGVRVAAHRADLRLVLPEQPPRTHADRAVAIALDAREIALPMAPAPFRNPVDSVALGVTVMGAIAAGQPREAAAAWRDSGGTLELDALALRWGTLAITGSGTVALDPELQPIGAFSGAIEGYDALIAAFVGAGRMRAGDARLARLALGMLAKPGPGGQPRIATSFTIQNGEMSLGPVKLGKAPRIAWE